MRIVVILDAATNADADWDSIEAAITSAEKSVLFIVFRDGRLAERELDDDGLMVTIFSVSSLHCSSNQGMMAPTFHWWMLCLLLVSRCRGNGPERHVPVRKNLELLLLC